MNFTEAKRAIGGIQRFLRALNTLDEVLDSAIAASDHLTQAEQRLDMVNNEMESTEAQLADLKPKLSKVKQQYDAKMAEVEAQVKARQEEQEQKLISELKKKTEELRQVNEALDAAAEEHDRRMGAYEKLEQEAQEKVEFWDKKLKDSMAAYEKFKRNL